MDNREPTPTEKLEMIARQIADLVPGQRPVLDCPYCGGRTRRGETFCCELMLKAVTAVLDANEQIQVAEQMDRILEMAN